MRSLLPRLGIGLVFRVPTHSSLRFIPLQHLEASTVALFQVYTEKFEQRVSAPFTASGKLFIDDESGKHRDYEAGKPIVEARESRDIQNGSIHHYSGSIRVPGATIDQVRRVMQDYSNYPNFFKPDVARTAAQAVQPDSTPEDEHFRSRLFLTESTVWLDVAYGSNTTDSHYRRIDANRWTSRSTTFSIRGHRDAEQWMAACSRRARDHSFL